LIELARCAGPGGRVFGIDLSEEMLKLSRKLVQDEGLADKIEFQYGDAAELPYPNESMDAIFMTFVLELFDTPEIPIVLAECRVLRTGGRILVVAVSKDA
jgi:demethylmenaquinone methyltransferase/2-methoxy-6-polyprenyl-1,4-benzoquinol methylase